MYGTITKWPTKEVCESKSQKTVMDSKDRAAEWLL